jgi:hypothetical protein
MFKQYRSKWGKDGLVCSYDAIKARRFGASKRGIGTLFLHRLLMVGIRTYPYSTTDL